MRNFNSCFIASLMRPSCSSSQPVPKCCTRVVQCLLLGPSPHACDMFNSTVPARVPLGPSPLRKTHRPLRVVCYLSHTAPHAVIHEMTFPPAAAWGLESPSKVSCGPKGLVPPGSPQGTCSLASSERADRFEGISSYCQSCLDSSPIDHICPCVYRGRLIQLLLTCPYSITLAGLWLLEFPPGAFFPLKGHSFQHLPALGHSSSFSFQL